jgi:hypothetical protein
VEDPNGPPPPVRRCDDAAGPLFRPHHRQRDHDHLGADAYAHARPTICFRRCTSSCTSGARASPADRAGARDEPTIGAGNQPTWAIQSHAVNAAAGGLPGKRTRTFGIVRCQACRHARRMQVMTWAGSNTTRLCTLLRGAAVAARHLRRFRCGRQARNRLPLRRDVQSRSPT